MLKKVLIITVLLLTFTISNLFAQKSLERIANEKGVEAETLYNDKKFVESAQTFEAAIAKLEEAVKTDGIPLDNEKISRWRELSFNGYYQGKKFENAIIAFQWIVSHGFPYTKIIDWDKNKIIDVFIS